MSMHPDAESLMRNLLLVCMGVAVVACHSSPGSVQPAPDADARYDAVIAGGRVVDGTGNAWFEGDVGIRGDRIVRVAPAGALARATAATRIDARGLVVAPGFIDIQGQSYQNLLLGDGRSLSKVTQGVTTEILGEGWTPAPLNDKTQSVLDFVYQPKDSLAVRRVAAPMASAPGSRPWSSTGSASTWAPSLARRRCGST